MSSDTTCFLIDDDEDDREIFTIALEDTVKGCNCLTANNGKDALHKLQENESINPNYIFLDLNMPIMDGKQTLRELRKIPRFQDTPVIIYTTSSHHKDMEETRQLGASHYLLKPSRIEKLTALLNKIFEQGELPFALNPPN